MIEVNDYQAVVFDYDDTLVKTIETKWAQHKETARRFYGFEITDEQLAAIWGAPFRELVAFLYPGIPVDDVIAKKDLIVNEFPNKPHEGAIQTVERLVNDNIRVGIVSAMTSSYVISDLNRIGFPVDAFLFVQGEDHTPVHKPDPRVFDPTLEHLSLYHIGTVDTLYIGDSIRDFLAAQGAGMGFVGVATGLTSIAEFESQHARAIASINKLL